MADKVSIFASNRGGIDKGNGFGFCLVEGARFCDGSVARKLWFGQD